MHAQIRLICNKHPNISKHIIDNVLDNDSNFSMPMLSDVISEIHINKQILKKYNFNILKFKNLEDIYDEIQKILKSSKSKTFIKKEVSLKNRHLTDYITYVSIKECLYYNLSLEELSANIFSKISSFKDSNQLNMAIIQFMRIKRQNTVTSL